MGARVQKAISKIQDFSNIAKPLLVLEHETNDYCYILYECHQPHYAICKNRSFTTVRKYSIGLLRALEHIHANGLIHANVTLHNVVLSQENEAVLTNFEHSSLIADTNTDIKFSDYLAPEVEQSGPCPASDIFSAGIIMAYLTIESLAKDNTSLLKRVKNHDKISKEKEISDFCYPSTESREHWCDLISKMMQKDPKKRISANQALQHPFFDEKYLKLLK